MDGHGKYWNTANSQKIAGLFQDEFTSMPFVHNYGEDNDVEETGFPEQPKDIHKFNQCHKKHTQSIPYTHISYIYIIIYYIIIILHTYVLCTSMCTCMYTCICTMSVHMSCAYRIPIQYATYARHYIYIISYILSYYSRMHFRTWGLQVSRSLL